MGVSRAGWAGTFSCLRVSPFRVGQGQGGDSWVLHPRTTLTCLPVKPQPLPGAFQLGSAAWSHPGGSRVWWGQSRWHQAVLWVKPEVLLDHWEQWMISRTLEGEGGVSWAPPPCSCQRHIILALLQNTAVCFIPKCLGRIECRLKEAAKFGCLEQSWCFPCQSCLMAPYPSALLWQHLEGSC